MSIYTRAIEGKQFRLNHTLTELISHKTDIPGHREKCCCMLTFACKVSLNHTLTELISHKTDIPGHREKCCCMLTFACKVRQAQIRRNTGKQ